MPATNPSAAIPPFLLPHIADRIARTPQSQPYGVTIPLSAKDQRQDLQSVNAAIRTLGLTARVSPYLPHTADLLPLWYEYLDSLPRYRSAQSGPWRLSRQRQRHHQLVTQYNPLTVSLTQGPPTRGYTYVLAQERQQEPTVWMSNSDMELATMSPQIEAAHGHVLVAGLGMGVYTHLVSFKPTVHSVTVLEPEPDVIALIAPTIANGKITVVQSTFEQYCANPSNHRRFDYCFIDIWPFIADSYRNGNAVTAQAQPLLTDGGKAEVWCQDLNDRKAASMTALEQTASESTTFAITTEPCYLCAHDFRYEVYGLCLECAALTWAETPKLNDRLFPAFRALTNLDKPGDLVARFLNITAVSAD